MELRKYMEVREEGMEVHEETAPCFLLNIKPEKDFFMFGTPIFKNHPMLFTMVTVLKY